MDEEEKNKSIFIKAKTGDENYHDAQFLFRKNIDETTKNVPLLPYDVIRDKKDTVIIKKDKTGDEWKKIRRTDPDIELF